MINTVISVSTDNLYHDIIIDASKKEKKKKKNEIIHMNNIQIGFVVYRATQTSDFCHCGLIVLSATISLIPPSNYLSSYSNHYKLTLIWNSAQGTTHTFVPASEDRHHF